MSAQAESLKTVFEDLADSERSLAIVIEDLREELSKISGLASCGDKVRRRIKTNLLRGKGKSANGKGR